MATLAFHKVDVLPSTLQANAVYIVKPFGKVDITISITDKFDRIAYRTRMTSDVSAQDSGNTNVFLAESSN